MSKLHLPTSRNPVANAQSSSLVNDDLTRKPTITDKLDLLTEFARNPDAPIPEFHIFDELDAIFGEVYEASNPELFDDLMLTLQGIKAMASIGHLNIAPLDDVNLDPVEATPDDSQVITVVLDTVDNPPASRTGVTNIFIFYSDFADNAPSEVHLPTILFHPRRHARRSVLFWLVVEFKFLAMRMMAVSSTFLLTMQDITKDEFARYREKHNIVWQ